jgi:hypothetical protein
MNSSNAQRPYRNSKVTLVVVAVALTAILIAGRARANVFCGFNVVGAALDKYNSLGGAEWRPWLSNDAGGGRGLPRGVHRRGRQELRPMLSRRFS